MGDGRPIVLMISQQQMLRAGNQVLLRTVEGYLLAGFDVRVILPATDDPQAIDPPDAFPGFRDRISTIRVRPVGEPLMRTAKRLLSRRQSGAVRVRGALTPPDPVRVLPFHGSTRNLAILPMAGFTLAAYRAGQRVIREEPVRVIAGFELMATPTAALLRTRSKLPAVGHFQGTFLCTAIGQGRAAYRRQWADYVGTAAPLDLYFMLNDGTRGDRVLAELGIASQRVRFRISGVAQDLYLPHLDRASFLGERYGLDIAAGDRVLLSMSKLTPWKRVERLLLAMPSVLRRYPRAHLFIGHRGPMRDWLEALARQLNVAHRVRFLGAIPHTDVAGLMNACDVFVSVNDHSNLSNPLLEALECARPIVTLDDGSTDGVLRDGENALLASVTSLPESLADRIVTLLNEPAFASQLSRAARDTAQRLLVSWPERIRAEMADVLELLAAPGPASVSN